MDARIYALKAGSFAASMIAPGSGIVGFAPDESGLVTVYFEGNINDACNLHDLNDRIKNAAGRMFMSYPTSALANLEADNLIEIGEIDQNYRITITDQVEFNKIEAEYKKKIAAPRP